MFSRLLIWPLRRTKRIEPPLWVIAMIAGLPLFSESMYTPALPRIAASLAVEEALVEYTVSIYLICTALGVIFWGKISDLWGRRPCILWGFSLYMLGCFWCASADSIYTLYVARVIQALGGSVGAVLAQAISHDVFRGRRRGQVFSTIGVVLALAPAIAPGLGGLLVQQWGWRAIFMALALSGVLAIVMLFLHLPETRTADKRGLVNTFSLLRRMVRDPKVLTCGALVGISNGIFMSYNAEGPFVMIDILKLSPVTYGLGFTLFAAFGALGSFTSKKLHNTMETSQILKRGVQIKTIVTLFFAISMGALWSLQASPVVFVPLILVCMTLLAFGRGLDIANCLSLGLEDYAAQAGTATALMVCFYYIIIASSTAVMGLLHNDTVLPMPLYMAGLALVAQGISFFVPPSRHAND